MTAEWTFSARIEPDHAAWAREGGYLLASPEWMHVLSALGAEPLFAWSPGLRTGLAIPVFRRLGLRIGFVGFPVVSAPCAALGNEALVALSRQLVRASGLDILRMTHGMQRRIEASAIAARPETWIDDLQAWSPEGDKKRRRDLAFARRAAEGSVLTEAADPAACHALYADTIRAHSGKLHYTPDYFSRLVALSTSCSRVGVIGAQDDTGHTRAFCALVVDGEVGYYLHGAADQAGKRLGLSDLLLEKLIDRARALGARRLSLMSSPWDQPGLSSFKRKWGDTSGFAATTDIAGSVRGAVVGIAVRWLHRADRRRAADSIGVAVR